MPWSVLARHLYDMLGEVQATSQAVLVPKTTGENVDSREQEEREPTTPGTSVKDTSIEIKMQPARQPWSGANGRWLRL